MGRTRAATPVLLFLAATAVRADTVHLKNGDQVSGKVAAGPKVYRVQTPYGRLLVPKDQIELIIYDDGHAESPAEAARPAASTKASPWRLELVVRGDSFWRAWDPREAPVDPALRLLVAVDGMPVASYTDRQLDSDIAGAVVNTFAFNPSATSRTLWNDTSAAPPEAAPGRVTLRLELPAQVPGPRTLILKYQTNLGKAEEPIWTDLAEAELVFESAEGAPSTIHVDQSRGTMSFGGVLRKKKMRATETFTVRLSEAEEDSVTSP
jgi:hypothetical protein